MLFECVDHISNTKSMEDKYQFQINEQTRKLMSLKFEKLDLSAQLNKTVTERDNIREELQTMVDNKHRMDKDKMRLASIT